MTSKTNYAKPSQDRALQSYRGYDYRSEAEIFGLPLIHIAQGFDPDTGRRRVAKGIIAIGDVAVGVIALGGLALGGIAIGGLGVGLLAFGGLALGLIAFGAVAFGLYFAMGVMAFSMMVAIGLQAVAPHYIGANGIDESFLRMIDRWFSH